MKYYYLDETTKQFEGYWHGIVGGLIIKPEQINDINYAINDQLNAILVEDNEIKGMQEIHLNNLFSNVNDDDLKLNVLNAAIQEIRKRDVKFMVSYAKIKKDRMSEFPSFFGGDPHKCILNLAFFNVRYFIQKITEKELLQLIIDAGFNASYKSLHNIYMNIKRGVDNARVFERTKTRISTPNFMNILPPAFVDSRDERLIQISDVIIGVQMWKQEGNISEFKQKIIDIVDVLRPEVEVYEVEWNKKST